MLAHTQFSAIVLMTLLALKLLLLPNKVAVNNVTNKSRWLMTGGIILIDVQFVLQYALGLRSMGVTQAVMLNLVMFIPVSWMMSVAILYLQRQGRVTTLDKVAGLAAWIAAVALIAGAAAIDGQPLLSSTPELRNAEIAASVCYSIMQIYYTAKHSINLVKMHSALQNYYDSDKMDILRWMQFSVVILMVLAIMTPILIFGSGLWLAVYALFFYGGIFYFVDSFCGYVVSSAPQKMQVAEANETFEENNATSGNDVAAADPENVETQQESLEESSLQRVEHAVEEWIEKGGYLKNGITMPNVADELHIPRYQLSAWLKQQGMTYSTWMTNLRIDEAKRVITAHPDWNNEAIANHCGFSDRTYFQKKFKEKTGLSPSDYIESMR